MVVEAEQLIVLCATGRSALVMAQRIKTEMGHKGRDGRGTSPAQAAQAQARRQPACWQEKKQRQRKKQKQESDEILTEDGGQERMDAQKICRRRADREQMG